MRELQQGLWWWTARHPEWTPDDDETTEWGPEVSSYAIDDGVRLLLIDPTFPPAPVAELAQYRGVVVVLTCPWHGRDTAQMVERFGATVWSPPLDDPAQNPFDAQIFTAGDRLEIGVEARPGMEPNDLVLWIESRRAITFGDTFIDRHRGFEFPRDWANKGVPADEILASLQPLRELPIELVLPTHGDPTDRATLERALG